MIRRSLSLQNSALLAVAVIVVFLAFAVLRLSQVGLRTEGVPTVALAQKEEGSLHRVEAGETLSIIADRYGLDMRTLIDLNGISDPNTLVVGMVLRLPEDEQERFSADSTTSSTTPLPNLLPDNILIYSPTHKGVDWSSVVPPESYLRTYQELVEGTLLDGLAIVQLVANRTRISPPILLSILEYRSGWVTQAQPSDNGYPLWHARGGTGLYRQLEWGANQLNFGYYARRDAGIATFTLADGTEVTSNPQSTLATTGMQRYLGAHEGATFAQWQSDVTTTGWQATYQALFGDVWAQEDETVFSDQLIQPPLALPWAQGDSWHFTGGPHGGWIAGSGWAALDFVPSGEQGGCYEPEQWVTAVADGVVSRSEFGALELDLDGDGYSGTGWVILYQHVSHRLQVGTRVSQGEAIGKASCEGGYSTGTHLHIGRLYHGRWVSADQPPYFNLGGWQAEGGGSEYNGYLVKGTQRIAANAIRSAENRITHTP